MSLQRLYVHRSIFDRFASRFADLAGALRTGDTLSPDTEVGALVDERAASRVSEWIAEAVSGGARLLCGGERNGNVISPAVLVDVQPSMKVVCEEVFGPVVSIIAFDRLDDVVDAVNDSPWGLASGIYTRSLDVALMAIRRLRTGILNVNAPSRFRVEHVPYGGLKLSGWGKEGPRHAVQEMTEVKMVIVSAP